MVRGNVATTNVSAIGAWTEIVNGDGVDDANAGEGGTATCGWRRMTGLLMETRRWMEKDVDDRGENGGGERWNFG